MSFVPAVTDLAGKLLNVYYNHNFTQTRCPIASVQNPPPLCNLMICLVIKDKLLCSSCSFMSEVYFFALPLPKPRFGMYPNTMELESSFLQSWFKNDGVQMKGGHDSEPKTSVFVLS
jgi:hypothetical protein